jgi:sensor histidine kinase YesM
MEKIYLHNKSITMKTKQFSIKSKLIFFSFLLIILISTTYFYSNINSNALLDAFVSNQKSYLAVNGLTMTLQENRKLLKEYLESGKLNIIMTINSQEIEINNYLKIISEKAESNVERHLARALQNGVSVYLNNLGHILSIRNALYFEAVLSDEDINKLLFTEYYSGEGSRVLSYLYQYTSQYLQASLNNDRHIYSQFEGNVAREEQVSYIMLFSILLVCTLFIMLFSNYIANPIRRLAEMSQRMAAGDLHVEKLEARSSNEVGVLINSFNQMSESIRNLVQDLEKKNEIEARLLKEEIKNSRIEELLKEARFQALQSQVNPHFLFNTLNIISRAVRFESPESATKLIKSLSEIFRYNLEHNEKNSQIRTELEIVKKYLFIQEFRFSDRLSFSIQSDPRWEHVLIPKLTLQPLVENSLIHGLVDGDRLGKIVLQVKKKPDCIYIRIFDNGKGINRERIKEILSPSEAKHTGHTTSVGVLNILNRIKLFCDGSFSILSIPEKWTMICLRIPCDV